MSDEHARRLDALLKNYADKTGARAVQQEKARTDELAFNAAAEEAFKKVIRPAIEAVHTTVRGERYDCEIAEQDETLTNDLKTRPKAITMRVRVPPPPGPSVMRTTHGVSFVVDRLAKKVVVTSASSLGGGQQPQPKPRTTFEVSQLTSDAVTGELVRFLEEVIR